VAPVPSCWLLKTSSTSWPLTLNVVSAWRMTWATSVPILVFLGLSVLELDPMYATGRHTSDVRQTDVRQKHRLMALPYGGGGKTMHHAMHTYSICCVPCSVYWVNTTMFDMYFLCTLRCASFSLRYQSCLDTGLEPMVSVLVANVAVLVSGFDVIVLQSLLFRKHAFTTV